MDDNKFSGNSDPAPEAEWEVWYQDLFDRECPRKVEVSGRGLVKGLAELWARHLFETVGVDGQKGFARFNLWWLQEQKSILVTGAWDGMVRLRQWIFGSKRTASKNFIGNGDQALLMEVALAHSCLVMVGQTSEPILTAVQNCMRHEVFQEQLLNIIQAINIRKNEND